MNIADVPLRENAPRREVQGEVAQIGRAIGSTGVGAMLHEVEPGKRAFPFHNHHGIHELFVILEGAGEYRFGKETYPIRAGDVLAAPAGGRDRPPDRQYRRYGPEISRYLDLGPD